MSQSSSGSSSGGSRRSVEKSVRPVDRKRKAEGDISEVAEARERDDDDDP